MNANLIAAGLAASVVAAAAAGIAAAQSVDDLLKDHKLLNSELDRCRTLGLASTDDARCKTAREAERQRFFGKGVEYTPKPVIVTPGQPVPPITNDAQPPSKGPPNGQ